ncbi:unnamed protein product [Pleuronectes platessa]|uniref:Uncharacterized protein n=1 Tax=Pleuronectes platessa TaxID=8262 RepID=A0A9N7VPR3_PLEPL|nr:unnamed protein product [Pleuronectes platessa]
MAFGIREQILFVLHSPGEIGPRFQAGGRGADFTAAGYCSLSTQGKGCKPQLSVIRETWKWTQLQEVAMLLTPKQTGNLVDTMSTPASVCSACWDTENAAPPQHSEKRLRASGRLHGTSPTHFTKIGSYVLHCKPDILTSCKKACDESTSAGINSPPTLAEGAAGEAGMEGGVLFALGTGTFQWTRLCNWTEVTTQGPQTPTHTHLYAALPHPLGPLYEQDPCL